MGAELRIGTSGYQYDHWRGVLYPRHLPRSQWFARYAQEFDTVEVNNTFYRVPDAAVFAGWRKTAPSGFCYAVKFSRFGSHMKKLLQPRETIGYFLERAERLGQRLGPILVQLPPGWKIDLDRLAAFLKAAPRRRRWAVEFREPSWLKDETYELLRRHRAALCIHDMIKPHPWEITADWLYLRYHGVRYRGNYSSDFLRRQARLIRDCLARGRDVYAYFNNDVGGHAVTNARDLLRMAGR